MSQEKKALVETAYGAAAAEAGQAGAEGGEPGSNKAAGASGEDDAARRGRTPSVLPGILGKQLRAAYGELLNAPVPDRFNDLIKQLERQETKQRACGTQQGEEESE